MKTNTTSMFAAVAIIFVAPKSEAALIFSDSGSVRTYTAETSATYIPFAQAYSGQTLAQIVMADIKEPVIRSVVFKVSAPETTFMATYLGSGAPAFAFTLTGAGIYESFDPFAIQAFKDGVASSNNGQFLIQGLAAGATINSLGATTQISAIPEPSGVLTLGALIGFGAFFRSRGRRL